MFRNELASVPEEYLPISALVMEPARIRFALAKDDGAASSASNRERW